MREDKGPRAPAARGLALLLAALVLVAACGGGQAGTGAGADASEEAGSRVPTFTAATLEGAEFDSAERFAKEPTVLWFWAPWCTICRAEASEVVAIADEFKGEVSFVGVAGRGEVDEMTEFVTETGTGGFEHVVDTDGAIWSEFGVVAQPAFAFVGQDGTVEVFNGALPPDELRAAVRTLAEG